jgi:hypothetical protein
VNDDDDPPLDNVTFLIRYLAVLGALTVEDLAAGRWPGRCLLGACRNLLHPPRTESHRR